MVTRFIVFCFAFRLNLQSLRIRSAPNSHLDDASVIQSAGSRHVDSQSLHPSIGGQSVPPATLVISAHVDDCFPVAVAFAYPNRIVTNGFLLRLAPLHSACVAVVVTQRQMAVHPRVENEL